MSLPLCVTAGDMVFNFGKKQPQVQQPEKKRAAAG